MASSNLLHHHLLRPPVIQILHATGYLSTRPAVIDTLTDLAARYLLLLASSTLDHALNNHAENPIPTLDDVLMVFQDVGALRPQKRCVEDEESLDGVEDARGLESFLAWFSGPANAEIRRVAGFIPSDGDIAVEVEDLPMKDYLTVLENQLSEGEKARFRKTILGKGVDDRTVAIEGGVRSIQEWGEQVIIRTRELTAESTSTAASSVPTSITMPEALDN